MTDNLLDDLGGLPSSPGSIESGFDKDFAPAKATDKSAPTAEQATAFKTQFKENFGIEAEEFGETVKEMRQFKQEMSELNAAEEFVVDHFEDFAPSPQNQQVMEKYLTENKLPVTRENLETAFDATKDELTGPSTPTKKVPTKPTQSGLSGRESVRTETPDGKLDAAAVERRAWAIPLDQLERELRTSAARSRGLTQQRPTNTAPDDF
jgi:hypothetical protein